MSLVVLSLLSARLVNKLLVFTFLLSFPLAKNEVVGVNRYRVGNHVSLNNSCYLFQFQFQLMYKEHKLKEPWRISALFFFCISVLFVHVCTQVPHFISVSQPEQ